MTKATSCVKLGCLPSELTFKRFRVGEKLSYIMLFTISFCSVSQKRILTPINHTQIPIFPFLPLFKSKLEYFYPISTFLPFLHPHNYTINILPKANLLCRPPSRSKKTKLRSLVGTGPLLFVKIGGRSVYN